MDSGGADLFFKDWFAEYNDPDGFMRPMFYSPEIKNMGLNNPLFDDLIEQAARPSVSPNERQALYIEAEKILCELETIVIPVIHHYIDY
jgi:oligopeptide transport system substrate-binding protein